ncbi:MAG: VapC ribonuclease [Candidatus Xenobia bacterium]
MTEVLVDSNIPMYLIGAPHPNKDRSRKLIEESIARNDRLVTDAEVFQEILHRYAATNRLSAVQPAFEALLGVVDEVFPVDLADAVRARDILLGKTILSARDAIHLAVMEHRGIRRILSFDAGFDHFPGINRIS